MSIDKTFSLPMLADIVQTYNVDVEVIYHYYLKDKGSTIMDAVFVPDECGMGGGCYMDSDPWRKKLSTLNIILNPSMVNSERELDEAKAAYVEYLESDKPDLTIGHVSASGKMRLGCECMMASTYLKEVNVPYEAIPAVMRLKDLVAKCSIDKTVNPFSWQLQLVKTPISLALDMGVNIHFVGHKDEIDHILAIFQDYLEK